MTFLEAMQAVIDGQNVSRLDWDDDDTYIALRHLDTFSDRYLTIHNSSKTANPGKHTFMIRDVDMLADDWFIIGNGTIQ